MSPVIAPWLRPTDVLGAIEGGARIGLAQRQMAEQAAARDMQAQLAHQRMLQEQLEAKDRLRLGYDQMAAASDERAMNEAARKEENALLNQHRNSQLQLEEKKIAADTYTPGISVVTDPITGQQYSAFRQSTRSSELMPGSNQSPTIKQIQSPSGESFDVFIPGGGRGTAQFINKRPETEFSAAAKAKLQQTIRDAEQAVLLGKELGGYLNGGTVGPIGAVSRIVDTAHGIMNPGGTPPGFGIATKAAQVATHFNSSIIKALKTDSQIAERERQQIEAALPKPDALWTSERNVRSALSTALGTAGSKSRAASQELGKPVSLIWLKPGDDVVASIRQALADDVITQDQARAYHQKPELLDGLNVWAVIKSIDPSSNY